MDIGYVWVRVKERKNSIPIWVCLIPSWSRSACWIYSVWHVVGVQFSNTTKDKNPKTVDIFAVWHSIDLCWCFYVCWCINVWDILPSHRRLLLITNTLIYWCLTSNILIYWCLITNQLTYWCRIARNMLMMMSHSIFICQNIIYDNKSFNMLISYNIGVCQHTDILMFYIKFVDKIDVLQHLIF